MRPPARQWAPVGEHRLADRQPDERRNLLRALEIAMRGLFHAFAFERDHALIAGHLPAGIDGEGQVAMARQIVAGRGLLDAGLVETRQRAQVRGRVKIDKQHPDRPIGLRLQLKPAFELERRAQERGERDRLAQELRDGARIGVALEQRVRAPGPSRTRRPRTFKPSTAKGRTMSSTTLAETALSNTAVISRLPGTSRARPSARAGGSPPRPTRRTGARRSPRRSPPRRDGRAGNA